MRTIWVFGRNKNTWKLLWWHPFFPRALEFYLTFLKKKGLAMCETYMNNMWMCQGCGIFLMGLPKTTTIYVGRRSSSPIE